MSSSIHQKKIFSALTAVFVVGIVFFTGTHIAYAGTLTASVTTAALCTSGGGTVLLRMSGATNAHAELPGQANANYDTNVVCGNGVTGLGNSCAGTTATILKLSGTGTNSHVEQNSQANYANNACISVSSGSVSVGYQATNCTGFDATIGSMSGTTNAHVGNSAAYPAIQICATATGAAVTPTITSYTNTTETALNSANCATTGCGARIGGAGFVQTVTITGTNFGADPGAANRSTATNNLKVGTHQIANANVTAWADTSITFLTDSSLAGDTDTDWGVNFGGVGAIKVTAGSQTSTGTDFYVFPQVTSITVPGGFPAESAREYDAGDTDGVITLNGTRFGTAQGSGSATLVGQTATPTGWGNTAVTLQVPTTIVDTTNTGAVSMTQGTGTNGKTTTYLNTLRVLLRITSFNPVSGIQGAAVTVNGNHFCQSGTCPGAFGANDKITFTSGVVATTFTSWSATAIVTAVPTGAVTGNVFVSSFSTPSTYTSNNKSFTVDANTTTLATGSDPAVNTIAPGAVATDVDLFTLQTNGGTEAVTSVTVNLSTNAGIGLLAITDNANTVLGSTASPVTGSNVITVSGLTAGTGVTTFKVRATPLSPTAMPAVPGAAYAITAPVTAFAGPNIHAGSDTNTNALTIDNLSPAEVTASTATAGDAQVSLAWTNPADADFHSTVVLRRTTSVVTDVPVEGTTYIVGNIIGASTVACVVATPTAVCTDSGLANGTAYYYKIFTKDSRVNYSSAGVVPTGSPATPIATQTLTVGTSGTQAVNLNSGTTTQHIGGVSTAAFTLQINNGTSNVTSVKVSETGTIAMANLANPKLYYETATSCTYNGNELNVAGAAPVGETVTFTLPSVAVGVGSNVTCLYFVSDVTSSAYGGQTIDLQITNPSTDVVVSAGVNSDTLAKAITGTTTVKPQITGYTNSTEPALDYAGACTGCGARIGGGSGFRHTVVISGYGFGADPGLGSRDTASNKVEIAGTATTMLADDASANTNVSAWSNTSITIRTDSTIATNTDTDFGTNFGGATALKVTAGGQAVPTNLNFYIFPQVTSVNGVSADQMREYDAGDTDGVITINGTRFGTAVTGGYSRILGCDSTTCASPTGTVTAVADATCDVVDGWTNTCIKVQVPVVIANNLYTGSIAMQQGTGSNNKTNSYSGLRVLPRITSLSPSSASINDLITVNGNHFCQSGTCPVAFGANDKVTFNSGIVATYWGAGGWTDTAIDTKVPTGATTGGVVVTSNIPPAYTSNVSTFTLTDATPTNPTNEKQARNSGITDLISAGGYASSTPVYFSLDTSSSVSGGTMYAQIELRPTTGVNSSFTSVCTANPYCFETNGGLSYTSGSITVTASTTSITDDVHHWQARVRYNKAGTDYYSGWVPYSDPAFRFDTIVPVVAFTGDNCAGAIDNLGTNGARISWSFTPPSDVADGQVEYSTDSNLSSSTFSPIPPSAQSSNHAITLSNLNSNTPYYFKVRSRDTAGNLGVRPSVSPYCSFTTSSNLSPAKTTRFHIVGKTSEVTSGLPLNQTFSVFMPELATSTKSAFVEIVGVYTTTAGSPTITVQVNSETSKVYALPPVSATSHFKILHQVSSVIVETANANTLTVTPNTNTSIFINSADINVNYSYTP